MKRPMLPTAVAWPRGRIAVLGVLAVDPEQQALGCHRLRNCS